MFSAKETVFTVGIRAAREEAVAGVELVLHTLLDEKEATGIVNVRGVRFSSTRYESSLVSIPLPSYERNQKDGTAKEFN